jgi:hypothetical protein
MEQIEFKILLRKPLYPVIVVSADKLYSAFNIKQLAEGCMSSAPIENKKHIQVVDSTGSEFWYAPEYYALTPGFAFKKWTKKQIVETFNNSENAKKTSQVYSTKSLSNKRLEKIVHDICAMLKS